MIGLSLPLYASEYYSEIVLGDVFLSPLPYFPATCNCVEFTRLFGIGDELVDEPCVLCGLLTYEGDTGHRAVIWEIRWESRKLVVVESNYEKCKITWRVISMDSPFIKEYVK